MMEYGFFLVWWSLKTMVEYGFTKEEKRI